MIQNKEIGVINSTLLAEYILSKYGSMSHLKLQKLTYYVQGFHLAYFDGQAIIQDDFEAWVHGPVSRKLFQEIRDLSLLYDEITYIQDEGKPTPEIQISSLITKEQKELIDDVLENYSPLSGLQLENLTHSEEPWLKARVGYGHGEKCAEIISKDSMKTYYRKVYYAEN